MALALRVGQRLKGAKSHYELTRSLNVLVKTSAPERKRFLKCEYDSYMRPAISSCTSLRAMLDIVGDPAGFENETKNEPPCLVFEWMDSTLADISPKDYLKNHALYKAIFKAGLESLAVLGDQKIVHTDLKPENILLSNLSSPIPIATIGDLGLGTHSFSNRIISCSLQSSDRRRLQRMAGSAIRHACTRDLERYGCSHRPDVWSLAATVLVWLKPGILGLAGVKDNLWPSLWCMAKIMGLFPGWTALPASTESIRKEAVAAKHLLEARDPERPEEMYMNVHPLDDELQTLGISD
ncbi:MAG: hypothetical protein M1829_004673 [Trizodia sp. TS-e1964]|nr:MAG: hypothetical protein M1829_004673 [Trizodia sp. TS-e1964]